MSDWQLPSDVEVIASRDTPSGLHIDFAVKPFRRYYINGVPVVSVTEALEVLDKPALPWWGMKIGVQGIFALIDKGVLKAGADAEGKTGLAWLDQEEGVWKWADTTRVVGDSTNPDLPKGLLTEHKLTVNHVKEEAGARGQTVHDAFERWAVSGTIPNPDDVDSNGNPIFLDEQHGYVVALAAFLSTVGEHLVTEEQEVIVGSAEYGYAGRFDWRGKLLTDTKVIAKVYPKAKPKNTLMEAGSYILDLKTSKDVYITHVAQLSAYEHASIESGYPATDHRAVLQVGADGRYQLRVANVPFEETYAHILATARAVKLLEEAIKV